MSGATIPDNLGMDKEVHQKEIVSPSDPPGTVFARETYID